MTTTTPFPIPPFPFFLLPMPSEITIKKKRPLHYLYAFPRLCFYYPQPLLFFSSFLREDFFFLVEGGGKRAFGASPRAIPLLGRIRGIGLAFLWLSPLPPFPLKRISFGVERGWDLMLVFLSL
jgi:hypothetical protein